MKKLIIIISIMLSSVLLKAQAFVDDIFNQYVGKPGFTSVVISPQLFKILSVIESDDPELKVISEKIGSLKILVSEDKKVGFTDVIRERISKQSYVSIMEVIEGSQKVNFYIKQKDDNITDLILLAIDDSEEVLLSITGNFKLSDLANLGKGNSILKGEDHLSLLKNLEEKN